MGSGQGIRDDEYEEVRKIRGAQHMRELNDATRAETRSRRLRIVARIRQEMDEFGCGREGGLT